ncbi:MAG: hypothetical protein ABIE74_05665 [Pseudomonadota bacterium]
MMYVGLTNDPDQRKIQHGNPSDWKVYGPFSSEIAARIWEKDAISKGYQGGPGGEGWKWGYTYTITGSTRQ